MKGRERDHVERMHVSVSIDTYMYTYTHLSSPLSADSSDSVKSERSSVC